MAEAIYKEENNFIRKGMFQFNPLAASLWHSPAGKKKITKHSIPDI